MDCLPSFRLPFATMAFVALAVATLPATAQTVWIAGEDLKTAEATGSETSNPNASVPAWSYGYRTTAETTSLTLYGAGNHTNSLHGVGLQGFVVDTYAAVVVNTGATNISINFGSSIAGPIQPGEIYQHPTSYMSVVRWTAPNSGSFNVNGFWRDIDAGSANGAIGWIVVNGSSVYSQAWAEGGQATPNLNLNFVSGDLVDFVTDSNASNIGFDSTAFNVTITAIPEPSTYGMIAGCLGLGVATWRQRRRIRRTAASCSPTAQTDR